MHDCQINRIGNGIWYFDSWTGENVYLSAECTDCAGVAFVALRDILPNEELYLDYKYDLSDWNDKLPTWYQPVNYY